MASPPDNRRVVLVMTVDIGRGRQGKIEIREGAAPDAEAARFVATHGLQERFIAPLSAHISQNLARVSQARSTGGTPGGGPSSARSGGTPTSEATSGVSRGGGVTPESTVRGVNDGEYGDDDGDDDGGLPGPVPSETPAPLAARRAADAEYHSDGEPGGRGGGRSRPQTAPAGGRRKVKKKGKQQAPVYVKLYEEAQNRQRKREEAKEKLRQSAEADLAAQKVRMSWVSKEMMRGRTAGEYGSYGERLYVEGVLQAEARQRMQERHKEEAESEEVEGLTFHPEISGMAKSIRRAGGQAWDRLSDTSIPKSMARRISDLQRESDRKETAECTFKPRISRKSKLLMEDRSAALASHRVSHHEQLYQDAHRRHLRQEEYQHWYPEEHTFQPQISATSSYIVQAEEDRQVPFSERMARAEMRRRQHLHMLELDMYGKVDPATGQERNKPKVGRGPAYRRNDGTVPVGDFLYNIRHEGTDWKEMQSQAEEERAREDANSKFTTAESAAIMSRLQRRRLRQIFEWLDRDRDGRVDLAASKEAGELEGLDPEVRADVEAATSASYGESLTEEAFCECMDAVLQRHKGARPTYLLPSTSRRAEAADFSHKPRILKKSRELATRRRHPDQSVQDALQGELAIARMKQERLKKQVEDDEVKECTFKPQLNGRSLRIAEKKGHAGPISAVTGGAGAAGGGGGGGSSNGAGDNVNPLSPGSGGGGGGGYMGRIMSLERELEEVLLGGHDAPFNTPGGRAAFQAARASAIAQSPMGSSVSRSRDHPWARAGGLGGGEGSVAEGSATLSDLAAQDLSQWNH